MKDLSQLKTLSLEELQLYQEQQLQHKAQLEESKAKGGKEWTDELQDKLDEVTLHLVDVEELIEVVSKISASQKYKVQKGTEKHLHLVISEAKRFDPKTGKSLNRERVQLFSYSEWRVFKKNFVRLGYIIVKILHDPYNEAQDFVYKED